MVRIWIKRIAAFILTTALMIGMLPVVEQPEKVWAIIGDGSQNSPYQVSTWSELYETLQSGGSIKLTGNVKYGEGGGVNTGEALIVTGTTVTLDLNGKVIDRGLSVATADGFVIKVESGATLALKDSSPAVSNTYTYSGNTIAVSGGIITGGKSNYYNGGIYNEGNLIMSGGSICGNFSAGPGGGVANSGSFTMFSGEISGNTSAGWGGGVYNSGSFIMSGGEISGNTANGLGGGGVENEGSFTMSGGSISGNTTNGLGDGGGVDNRGSFGMSGGEISGNTANASGGGVDNSGSFMMSDGEISGNTANYGGGVDNSGSFMMSDGEISGNTANGLDGGGVYNTSSFTMSGGKISGNTAENSGGGVYHLGSFGPFTMSGGEISGNTATDGGGVYISNWYDKYLMVSGNPKIRHNIKSGSAVKSNLYVDSGTAITITGAGLSAGASIGVTLANTPSSLTDLKVFTNGNSVTEANQYHRCFFSDDPAFSSAISSTGAALFGSPVITKSPENLTLNVGYREEKVLSVETDPALNGYAISFRWCTCDAAGSNVNPINAATGSSYTIPVGKAPGKYYYLCDVTVRTGNTFITSKCSDTATVTINGSGGSQSHTHSYTATVIKPPTITEPGSQILTCSECGHRYTETIPCLMEQDFRGMSVRDEAKVSGKFCGKDVSVSVKSVAYSKVPYTGNKISPKKDLGAVIDLSGLTSIITTNGKYTPEELFKVSYVSGNNQSVKDSDAKKAPYFYTKITLKEKRAKKAGLTKKEIKELKALIKKLNKKLKKDKCHYTIEKVDISAPDVTVTVKATIKKRKLTNVKSVKVKYLVNREERTIKIPEKQCKVTLFDADAKTVTVKGKGNFTGSTVVEIG